MGDNKKDPSNRSIHRYKKQLLEANISSSGIQSSNSSIPFLKLVRSIKKKKKKLELLSTSSIFPCFKKLLNQKIPNS